MNRGGAGFIRGGRRKIRPVLSVALVLGTSAAVLGASDTVGVGSRAPP
ncbi:hypothetical protein [Pyxidicoccus trucidator]|nr:hypothetical protein [Pyxidicoccus trucidator]